MSDGEGIDAVNAIMLEVSQGGTIEMRGNSALSPSTAADSDEEGNTSISTPSALKTIRMPKQGMMVHITGYKPIHFNTTDHIQAVFDHVDENATAGYTLYYMGKDLFTLRGRLMKEIFIPNIINKVKLVAPRIGVQEEVTWSTPAKSTYTGFDARETSSFVKTEKNLRGRKRKSTPISSSRAEVPDVTSLGQSPAPTTFEKNGTVVEYLNGDESTPLYSREPCIGKTDGMKLFLRALTGEEDLPICTKVPQRCMINGTFIVNTLNVRPTKSIINDGLGSFLNNSGLDNYYIIKGSEAQEITGEENYHKANCKVRTQYFTHKRHRDFKRRIVNFFHEDMSHPMYSLFVYLFSGPEHYIDNPKFDCLA